MDLYEILGVSRTAGEADIKAAYRAKAKTLHPDHGGDTKKFADLHAAFVTLSDPDKRKRYDDDGTTDFEADNQHARCLELISRLLEPIAVECCGPNAMNFNGEVYVDVVDSIRGKLRQAIADMTEKADKMEGAAKRLDAFAERFTSAGKPFLRMMIEAKARMIRHGIPNLRKDIDMHEAALELLKDQSFRFDQMAVAVSYQDLIAQQQSGTGAFGFR